MSRPMHPNDAEDASIAWHKEKDREREQKAIDWIAKQAVPGGKLYPAYYAHLTQFEHPEKQSPQSFAEDMRDGNDPLWQKAMEETE